jgi:hypothetical protein
MEAAYAYPHSLERTNGRFADADLARILQNATAASANAFGARGTPEVLRVVELLSIQQGREWGACTVRTFCHVFCRCLIALLQLNEFRVFMGLNRLYTLGLKALPKIADNHR